MKGPDKASRKQSVTQNDLSGFVSRAERIDQHIFACLEIECDEALQGGVEVQREELL
jgi:uncharacterized protein (UPF0335 family)